MEIIDLLLLHGRLMRKSNETNGDKKFWRIKNHNIIWCSIMYTADFNNRDVSLLLLLLKMQLRCWYSYDFEQLSKHKSTISPRSIFKYTYKQLMRVYLPFGVWPNQNIHCQDVRRNAYNMNFTIYKIVCCSRAQHLGWWRPYKPW